MKKSSYPFETIGIVHSPFKEKFGTPRQPGLIKQTLFSIEMLAPYDCDEAFDGLDNFSHLWISFIFHQNKNKPWSPKVRPPRLGGNQRVGVFASRSPYRPNPIGLSVVELTGLRRKQGKLFIDIKGADLIEGTPVVDIKPYVPYADCVVEAKGGYATTLPTSKLNVQFSDKAAQKIIEVAVDYPDLKTLIEQVLELDPRPAYLSGTDDKVQYGIKLLDFDIRWETEGDEVLVLSLESI